MRRTLPAAFVFLCICVVYIRPIEAGDFWWHLATGRWIVDNGTLPETDPFSYTASDDPGPIASLILKTYWLSQVLMYQTYRTTGFDGIIIFRALFYTLIAFALYRALLYEGLGQPVALVLTVLAAPGMTSYLEARPQAVSFLLSLVVFLLLERLGKEKDSIGNWKLLLPLPLIMLLWGNLHGGYTVGLGLIGVFLAVETARTVRRGFDRRLAILASVCAAAVLAAALNPNGLNGLLWVAALGSREMASAGAIHEYLPPLQFYAITGDARYVITLYAVLILMLLSFLAAVRRLDTYHVLLAAAFTYAALTHFRFGSFFFLFGILFTGANVARLLKHGRWTTRRGAALAPVVAAALVLAIEGPRVSVGLEEDVMPVQSNQYISESHPPAQILAPYEWGGFFIWSLYPEYQSFIDGRALDDTVFREYREVVSAGAAADEILRRHDVNTIVTYTIKPVEERIQPLTFALLKSDAWLPVHWDTKAMVFVRADRAQDSIERAVVWRALTSLAQAGVMQRPEDPEAHALLAEVYYQQGLPSFARTSFKRALALDPEHQASRRGLSLLRRPPGATAPGLP